MLFVLDCSISISWCLVDENNTYANQILDRMTEDHAIVPQIWSLEIANTFLVAERRGRMTSEQTKVALSLLQTLPIEVDPYTDTQALSATLELARHQGIAAYDAAYLELALRRNLALATNDRKLTEAAYRAGVNLLEIK